MWTSFYQIAFVFLCFQCWYVSHLHQSHLFFFCRKPNRSFVHDISYILDGFRVAYILFRGKDISNAKISCSLPLVGSFSDQISDAWSCKH
jgi:hypothetical protein